MSFESACQQLFTNLQSFVSIEVTNLSCGVENYRFEKKNLKNEILFELKKN